MSQNTYAQISALFMALSAQFDLLADGVVETIDPEDLPDAGAGDPPAIINTPADQFTGGADVAAVFTPLGAADPIYAMLPAANGLTREQYLATPGWTDELLVQHNIMSITYPKSPEPVVPPAPPAPSAAVPTPPAAGTPTPAGIELDSSGLPWDARIHSGGRTKKANGEWVARKGVQPNVVAQVTAELRQNPPGATPFVAPPAAHVPLAPSAVVAAPNPAVAPPPPATSVPKTKEQVLAQAQAEASLDAAKRAAPVHTDAEKNAVPTDAKSLMQWVTINGYGAHMQTVSNMLGLAGFGLILQPQNAHFVPMAHQTFLALAQGG